MTDFFVDFSDALWRLLAEAAPYLLVGFFLAGLVKALIPERKVYRYLGQDNLKSVGLAALFGAPLPLCSCSVLPAAASLRKSGASKGATTSFLISTPETGLDSIGITYALIDPIMTIVRPIAAILTAVFTGSLVNLLVRRGADGAPHGPAGAEADESERSRFDPSAAEVEREGEGANGPACACEPPRTNRTLRGTVQRAATYSFGPLMDDLVGWFILGFLASGIIAVAVPDNFFSDFVPNGWLSSIVMVVIGTPMYICATSATPIAVALIAKGLDPGAALVLLLVGPATNATTMLVVARFLGKRILVLYLAGVVGGALLLGSIVDAIYAQQGIELATIVRQTVTGSASATQTVAALILLALLLRSARRVRLLERWGGALRRVFAPIGIDPLSRRWRLSALGVLVLAYASTCFSVIGPGKVGWVERFGRVTQSLDRPGLYSHLPFPIDRVRTMRPMEIRSLEFGFDSARSEEDSGTWRLNAKRPAAAAAGRDLAAEAEVMDGGENILRITYSVHFDVANPYTYQYRLDDPEPLVRAFAEGALRRVAARYRTSFILVGHRDRLENETREALQADLDSVKCGIHITAIALYDVHAPEAVHPAFRDVASALEDKARKIRQAEAYQVETLASARAKAFSTLRDADVYRSERVNVPAGQAAGFLDRLAAFRSSEKITRLRLYFEKAEEALRHARLVMILGEGVRVELWNLNEKGGKKSATVPRSPPAGASQEGFRFPFGKEYLPKKNQ